ncbi:MAG: hypothetical protein R2724_08535 [Bryobacterales bacterium]
MAAAVVASAAVAVMAVAAAVRPIAVAAAAVAVADVGTALVTGKGGLPIGQTIQQHLQERQRSWPNLDKRRDKEERKQQRRSESDADGLACRSSRSIRQTSDSPDLDEPRSAP